MREIFLQYAKTGAMTKKQLASVLQITERQVGDMVRAGKIPTIPGIRHHRFDPDQMIKTFCDVPSPKGSSSLTIERHKTGDKPSGGFRKCL